MAERESSGSLPKRKSSRKGISCADVFLIFAFGLFAAIALFYSVLVIFMLFAMKFHLEAFGVQIYPFLSTDKLPHSAYFSCNALPWGLASLGVFTGSKLLLLPLLICKTHLAYATIRMAAMNWENNFKNQDVVLAAMQSYVLVFILFVILVMACASHRTLGCYYFGTGEQCCFFCCTGDQRCYYCGTGEQRREVRINIARRVEEGEVDVTAPRIVEAEEMKRRMETLLWKREEELVAARVAAEQGGAAEDEVTEGIATAPTESGGIYPVLGSPASPV